MGITAAPPVSIPIPTGSPWALLCVMLLGLIVALIKDTIDIVNKAKQDNWVLLRHYTKYETVELILSPIAVGLDGLPIFQMIGSAGGECPVLHGGPYLTNDVFITTEAEEDREFISSVLGIKDPPPNNDPREVTAFIDIRINTTDYPNYLSEFNKCVIRGGTQLHHSGPLFFGPPESNLAYKLL